MTHLPPGTRVTCSYRVPKLGPPHVGVVESPTYSNAVEYCDETARTPVRYEFGLMFDKDYSLLDTE